MAHQPVRVIPVVTRVFDIKDIVERLDPTRHTPEPAYEFSRGRRFVKPEGSEYRDTAPISDEYVDGSGNPYVDQTGEPYADA